MKKNIEFIRIYWRKLSAREQLSIAVTFFAVIVLLWKVTFYQDLDNNKIVLKAELSQIENNILDIDKKIKTLESDKNFDPDKENKRLLAAFLEENKRLSIVLKEASAQIIPVQDMVDMMRDVLKNQVGLKFVSLENRPAVSEFVESAKKNSPSVQGIIFYRHAVILKLEGSYQSLFAYLEILESMPWRFFWQGIDIKVTTYPNAQITLELYTLGFGRGVLGV